MCCIVYQLVNTGPLETLASPGSGQPGTLPQGMGNQPGLYLIYNALTNNRYIGKSGDTAQRFAGRMLTINEFGLTSQNLSGIAGFWGTALAFNTPLAPPNRLPYSKTLDNGAILWNGDVRGTSLWPFLTPGNFTPGSQEANFAAIVQANVAANLRVADPDYTQNNPTVTLDGQSIDVERLLIRFWLRAGMGGTITNGQKDAAFTNPTANDLIVIVWWGPCTLPLLQSNLDQGFIIITIPAGRTF
jgi:hypothetical protein